MAWLLFFLLILLLSKEDLSCVTLNDNLDKLVLGHLLGQLYKFVQCLKRELNGVHE